MDDPNTKGGKHERVLDDPITEELAAACTEVLDLQDKVAELERELEVCKQLVIDTLSDGEEGHEGPGGTLERVIAMAKECHELTSFNGELGARVEVLEKAQTLRPMADVPIGDTLVLARHTSLGWLSVARACDDLEFRGRQGLAWSGEYFHGWIPMPVLPDQSVEGGS